ncbi:glycogen/starch synthase [Shewanella psychrotolerans]|nr:glycogen/starch synthase [Shewanella psychrotolerans]QYK03225.1 glycogen/starch synthase [Shewanella psychrotolerans]
MKRVLMLAAENGLLPGAKVGGMADVIRDLPGALYPLNVCVDVAMPSYGFLHLETASVKIATITLAFYGEPYWVDLYQASHPQFPELNLYLFDHPLFEDGGNVYSPSSGDRPFADDANKFALFCAAVAEGLVTSVLSTPDCLHLHDWHCGVMAFLRACSPYHQRLQSIPVVMSIHNLAIQGTRPLTQEHSSLQAWFPTLYPLLEPDKLKCITDPQYPNCFNPMRCAIVFSDRVHLVSPSYANEVLLPSNHDKGFYGGEGLENDLALKQAHKGVFGILNGCEYPFSTEKKRKVSVKKNVETGGSDALNILLDSAEQAIQTWLADHAYVRSVDQIALLTLNRLRRSCCGSVEPSLILTSVGRLTEQKMRIMCYRDASGVSTLAKLLSQLQSTTPKGVFILLGSGDEKIEAQLTKLASKFNNLLFINGFDLPLSQALYDHGSLFIMPSSFEPCGISQMLAMRSGQPCLVHGVGGLKDTVTDGEDGFVFTGEDLSEQADQLLNRFNQLQEMMMTAKWQQICDSASQKRFSWQRSAQQYVDLLYQF